MRRALLSVGLLGVLRAATSVGGIDGCPTDGPTVQPFETPLFRNPHFPACCKAPIRGDARCMHRIPLVLTFAAPDEEQATVLAFSEHREGAARCHDGTGCDDGAGPAIALRRSADGGRTFSPTSFIANDTDPVHVARCDGVVIGSVAYEPRLRRVYLFYTSGAAKADATQAYVLRSDDGGLTWSDPARGNLTSMFETSPLGQEGFSLLQFGQGYAPHVAGPAPGGGPAQRAAPWSRLVTCGWYGRTKARSSVPGHYQNAGVVCIASDDHGERWHVAGRLPNAPNASYAMNEVSMATLRNGSLLLNMRDGKLSLRRWLASPHLATPHPASSHPASTGGSPAQTMAARASRGRSRPPSKGQAPTAPWLPAPMATCTF